MSMRGLSFGEGRSGMPERCECLHCCRFYRRITPSTAGFAERIPYVFADFDQPRNSCKAYYWIPARAGMVFPEQVQPAFGLRFFRFPLSSLPLSSFPQCNFSRFDDFGECRRIVDGHFGQGLAVKFDLGFFQASNEFPVTQSKLPSCRIYSRNPKCSEFPFSDSSVSGCVAICPNDRLLDGSEQRSASASKAFNSFE